MLRLTFWERLELQFITTNSTMSFLDAITNLISKGKESPAKTAFLVATIVASSALAYSYLTPSSSNLAPAMEEKEVKEIMAVILKKLKMLVPKLLTAAQNIKMQIEQQGQEVDDASVLKHYILPHFTTNLQEIQNMVLEEFDADEDELEEAVEYYIARGDEELASMTKSIRAMHMQFGGDSELEAPAAAPAKGSKAADMGVNDVVEMLKELATIMVQYSDDFCGKFVDENGIPADQQSMEEFQYGLMACSQKAEKVVLEEFGISESDLQSLLMGCQDNRQVQEVFMGIQLDSQKVLLKHGIRMQ